MKKIIRASTDHYDVAAKQRYRKVSPNPLLWSFRTKVSSTNLPQIDHRIMASICLRRPSYFQHLHAVDSLAITVQTTKSEAFPGSTRTISWNAWAANVGRLPCEQALHEVIAFRPKRELICKGLFSLFHFGSSASLLEGLAYTLG
jgi:hypothetical protein